MCCRCERARLLTSLAACLVTVVPASFAPLYCLRRFELNERTSPSKVGAARALEFQAGVAAPAIEWRACVCVLFFIWKLGLDYLLKVLCHPSGNIVNNFCDRSRNAPYIVLRRDRGCGLLPAALHHNSAMSPSMSGIHSILIEFLFDVP